MKLGFFYSGTIMIDKSQKKYGVAYTDKLFSRYLSFCDEIEVCMRVKHIEDGRKFSEITLPNLHVTELPNLSSIKGHLLKKKAQKTIDGVVRDCDCVIIRVPSDIAGLVANACKKYKKEYLLEMVGCAFDAYWYHSTKGKIIALPNFLSTKRIVKHAPNVIYVTEKFLENRYPTDGKWIACSDVELLDNDENVLDLRAKRIENRKEDSIIIGSMGAVNIKYKGQERIIRALGLLKENGTNRFRYQIVGNGDQSYLREIVRQTNTNDIVEFIGGLPHQEVFNWLDNVDIYIQPSMTEGLPRSVVEAMSRGALCMGTNVGGLPELISTRFLFDNTKKAHVRLASILLTISAEDYYKEAKRGIERAKDFREENLEKRRQDFYKKVFGKK